MRVFALAIPRSCSRRPPGGAVRWLLAATLASAPAVADRESGAIVESAGPAFEDRLPVGSRIDAWGYDDTADRPIDSPIDLWLVERTHDSDATIVLRLTGDDDADSRVIRAPAAAWELDTRPVLAPDTESRVAAWMADLEGDDNEPAAAVDALVAWMARRSSLPASRVGLSVLERASRFLVEGRRLALAGTVLEAAVRRAHAIGDRILEAAFLERKAEILVSRGETEASADAARAGLDILGDPASVDATAVLAARLHRRLAIAHLVTGDHVRASAEVEAGLARIGPRKETEMTSLLIGTRAILDALEGRRGAAARGFERAVAIRAPLGLSTRSLENNLASLAMQLGDWARAEASYRSLLEQHPDHPLYLQNLANLLAERGEDAQAEALFERAIAAVRAGEGDPLTEAAARANLAEIARRAGRLDASLRQLESSIAILRRAAPRSIGLIEDLSDLAALRRLRGELPEAVRALDEASALLEEAMPTAGARRRLLTERAAIAAERDDHQRAATLELEAVTVARDALPDSPQLAEHLYSLGLRRSRLGDLDGAESALREAVAILDRQRGRLGGGRETRARFGAAYGAIYGAYRDLLLTRGKPRAAFEIHERSRAQSLRELLSERSLDLESALGLELETARRNLAAEYDTALATRARVADGTDADALEAANRQLESIRRRRDDLESRIRAASPALAAVVYPRPVDLDTAQEARDAGTLVLSYALGAERTTLFTLGPEPGRFEAVDLGHPDAPRERIRARVREVRSALGEGPSRRDLRRLDSALASLSDSLLAPVRDALERAERVVIVPDDALHALPFAALNVTPNLNLRDRPVSVVSSVTVATLLEARAGAEGAPRLTAFGVDDANGAVGDPIDPGTIATLRGRELGALRFARQEVETLARVFPGRTETFLGAAASEHRARSAIGDATHVHFAAHAVVDPTRPMDSGLMLAPEADTNGFLQAWEIVQSMRLDADLVSLSACETALGEDLGSEGMLSLATAFQIVGARSVLATLWRVSDRASAAMMERFYRHLGSGEPKDRALAHAMRDLASGPVAISSADGTPTTADLSHPYYWAGYVLIGDGR